MLAETVGPKDYHRDDEWRDLVIEEFRLYLTKIIATAESAGTRVILVTPACNLRSCTPFKSEPDKSVSEEDRERFAELLETARQAHEQGRFSEALAAADEGLAIDQRHAEDIASQIIEDLMSTSGVATVDMPGLLPARIVGFTPTQALEGGFELGPDGSCQFLAALA